MRRTMMNLSSTIETTILKLVDIKMFKSKTYIQNFRRQFINGTPTLSNNDKTQNKSSSQNSITKAPEYVRIKNNVKGRLHQTYINPAS